MSVASAPVLAKLLSVLMPIEAQLAASAIVLAGGASVRLGADKAFLVVDGRPLVARIVDILAVLSDDLIVVTNMPDRYAALDLPARVVPDERPGEGSLMGIYSGLLTARYAHALIVGCDMPFLNADLLRYLLRLAPGYDVVIPRVGDLLEPLHAVYSRDCLPLIAPLLHAGRRQIVAFFSQARVRYVDEPEIDPFDPHHLSFLNVNTPADWARAQDLLSQG